MPTKLLIKQSFVKSLVSFSSNYFKNETCGQWGKKGDSLGQRSVNGEKKQLLWSTETQTTKE